MSAEAMGNLNKLMTQCVGETADMAASCAQYLQIFNEGIHYSFVASVAAMLISLVIFFATKRQFPNPGKKEAATAVTYTAEEKATMAKETNRRLYALFCSAWCCYLLLVLVPSERYFAVAFCKRLR